MKVLFVATVDPSGNSGHNIATREVISALLRKNDIELMLICPEFADKSFLTSEIRNVSKIVHISFKKRGSLWWNFKMQFQVYFAYMKITREGSPNLIMARMGNCLTLPIIVMFSKVPYYLLIRSLGHRDIKKLSSLPGVHHAWKIVAYLNCRAARQVLVAYEEVKMIVMKYRKYKQPVPIVFPNAVNMNIFPLTEIQTARNRINLSVDPSDFLIGFVGSLKKRHCLNLLVDAMQIINENKPTIKACIVGEGPSLELLRRYVKDSEMDQKILFTGFIPHDQVYLYMSAADVLYGVIDPLEVENPIKCYEYLATARPIITSESNEFKFIELNQLGCIIKKHDAKSVAEAITELYDLGRSARIKMGLAGREYVSANHTWDKMIDYMVDDYKQL